MKTSESIANIAEALAKAQAEIANPVKDRTARVKSDKADYTYNYADLANVLDAVRPPLAKHGIAIIQAPAVAGAVLTMTTRLIHSSGEWIEAELSSEVDPSAKIQTLGSAITYLRRYSLQAIVGVVAEEDDDGNAAQGNRAQTEQRPAARAASAPAPVQKPAAAKPAPVGPATAAKPPTAKERFDTACDAINERLGSKAGHDLIMAIKNKHGGDSATNDQKLLVIADLERTLSGEAVLPLATAAP
jgi:hypothetical protein